MRKVTVKKPHIFYRELKAYKYQLMDDYFIQIPIKPPAEIIEPPAPRETYISLDTTGMLTIRRSYAWDGPSGPAIDTKNFMRGSLVHDALYQLMRQSRLGQECREQADDLLRDICLQDGMSRFRAWYVHIAVRLFAAGAAKPGGEEDLYVVVTAP